MSIRSVILPTSALFESHPEALRILHDIGIPLTFVVETALQYTFYDPGEDFTAIHIVQNAVECLDWRDGLLTSTEMTALHNLAEDIRQFFLRHREWLLTTCQSPEFISAVHHARWLGLDEMINLEVSCYGARYPSALAS